jgi:hypothetical protein
VNAVHAGVPWYVHPAVDEHAWATLAQRRPRPSFVVINVHNGPGGPDDEWYPAAVSMLSRQRLLGYVDLGYGERSPREVQDDVRAWLDRYPVSGVMFDQYPSHRDSIGRCAEYVSAARSSGARFIVGNPGTVPDLGHLAMLDVTCVFEGSAAAYADFRPPAALGPVPPDRLWHLVHTCPPEDLEAVTARAALLGAGHTFVTDRVLPHPWGGFPIGGRTAEALVG